MVRINLNEMVKFKLTPHGEKILFDSFGYQAVMGCYEKDCYGERRICLWEFMSIFGSHMANGADPIIEGNIIVIGDGNEHV